MEYLSAILFLAFTTGAFASSYDLHKIDLECSEGSEKKIAKCYELYNKKITAEMEVLISNIKNTFVNSRLLSETQPVWDNFVNKWCEGRVRLNSSWGEMIYHNCVIDHTIKRIEQLNIYYCDSNGCPDKK